MHSDEIIEGVGGMSRFQVMLAFVILGPKSVMVWSLIMMSFAGVAPENWWCADVSDGVNTTESSILDYSHAKTCPSSNNSLCQFEYTKEKYTVINQWDLICDNKGIKSLIIAVQMGGVLVGSLVGGQSADTIGRKKTYMIGLLLHAGFNLVAAFSTSWQMFAALRFVIGSMVGAMLAVCTPYFVEFVGRKWRPIAGVIPAVTIGTSLLALACWLRPNWSDLHIILAIMHIPFLLGWIVTPESLRWLAVHGHLEEAEKVVDQMARYNGTQKPGNTAKILKQLAEEQLRARESSHKYTYIDIYRNWSLCWKSFIIQFTWMGVSFVYFGISFGVGHLHGNLYLNMFLLGIIGLPGSLVAYFLNNRIGRRWTSFTFFVIASIGALGVVVASHLGLQGHVTTALALTCRLGVSTAWECYMLMTSETYPTSIRNLGYGAASSAARLGSIISPFVFVMEGDDLCIPFIIVCSVMAVCSVLCLVMRETMGKPLQDTTRKNSTAVCKCEIEITAANVSTQCEHIPI